MKLKIGIIGTRGIPNNYGGFEQITEYLSVGLSALGHDITVYNSHNHLYQQKKWKGVNIIHCYDPEYIFNTAGQFIYDFNCIQDARKREFDVLLIMGYSSSSVWRSFFPKESVIIYNMDGLEWKRSKYSKPVQRFLKYAEKLAIQSCSFHIADSTGIQEYLNHEYNINCTYIPYGADLKRQIKESILRNYQLVKNEYFLLIARMEPENNIDIILEGFTRNQSPQKFIVVGNTKTRHGRFLLHKFKNDKRIQFTGALFDHDIIHTLRANALLYFHGHSVGGTNPSLLEAMASKVMIVAHDNVFNRSILKNNALYFSTAEDINHLLQINKVKEEKQSIIEQNYKKIKEEFNWENVISQYDEFICTCYERIKIKEPFRLGTLVNQQVSI